MSARAPRRPATRRDPDAPQFPRSEANAAVGLVEFKGADGERYQEIDFSAMAIEYAERCLDGRILVGKRAKQACKRFLTMLERSKKAASTYYFSDQWVVDVCLFLENLPHVEGWEGTIEVQPFQAFIVAAIYGFRRKGSGARLVRDVTIIIPRKNAKSLLSAGLSLVGLLLEGENGPTVLIGASTLEQAGKVYDPARMMVLKDEDLRTNYQLRALSRAIHCGLNGGAIKTITSVAEAQDGHNPSMVVLEELHAQKHGLYQVMASAFGARTNPMMLKITTAGRVAGGLVWEQWRKAERLLQGAYKNDEEFAIIYGADKEDLEDPYSDRTMMKCNPMWGISVRPENARTEAKKAVEDGSYRSEYLRTRLNVFSNAAEALFDPYKWDACTGYVTPKKGPKRIIVPDDFPGCPCWIGVDLALRNDMVAIGLVFEVDRRLVVFAKHYIPVDSPALSDPDRKGMYESWIEDERVVAAGDHYIDLLRVEMDLVPWIKRYNPGAVAIDPSYASHFASKLFNAGHPIVEFKNTAENMSEPTDDLRVRAAEGPTMLLHDGNPVLAWNAANVVGRRNERGLLLPKKENKDSPNKIDGIHAIIFANACRMKDKVPDERDKPDAPHPWTVRGMLGADDDGEARP